MSDEAMRIAAMLADVTSPTYNRQQLNEMGYSEQVSVPQLNRELKVVRARELYRAGDPEHGSIGRTMGLGFTRDEGGEGRTKIVHAPGVLIYAGRNHIGNDGSETGRFEIAFRSKPNPERQKDGDENARTEFLNRADGQVVYRAAAAALGKISTLAIEFEVWGNGKKVRVLRDVFDVRPVTERDVERLQLSQQFIQANNIQVLKPRG